MPHTYAPERLDQAYALFLARHPGYAATSRLDDLRATDYARLDRLGHVYLDYTGGSLYGESQLRRHQELLAECVLGNPHSHNPVVAGQHGAGGGGPRGGAALLPGLARRV